MATYYVDSAAANDLGDGSIETPFKTLAHACLHATSIGDIVYLKRGSTFREQLTIPVSGDGTHQNVWSAYGSGDLPKIYGSTACASWTEESSNIWYASTNPASDPYSLFFINTDTSISWGKEETVKGNLTAAYEWYWDGSKVYVYSEDDPGTAYSGIEAPQRTKSIDINNKDYITISYIESAFCISTGTGTNEAKAISVYNGDYAIIEHCLSHHHGYATTDPQGNGICIWNTNGTIVRNNVAHNCARRGIVLFSSLSLSSDDVIIEHNECYDNYHSGINVFLQSDGTSIDNLIIRYNFVHLTSAFDSSRINVNAADGMLITGFQGGESSTKLTNLQLYYNLVVDTYGVHITLDHNVNGAEIYNNIVYGMFAGTTNGTGFYLPDYWNSNYTIKNNIGMDCGASGYSCFSIGSLSDVTSCDYNCWYQSAGGTALYVVAAGQGYHYNDFDANNNYKGDTGWDTHGLWEDPHFVNAGGTTAEDYKLASDSPCINAGVDVGLTQDYFGNNVPE